MGKRDKKKIRKVVLIDKHSMHYKADYQDYDWCYQHFINEGMSHKEMAELANCSVRVIKKWCVERHRLTNDLRGETVKLTDRQRSIIIGGLLGDGHIDKREKYPLYILSHAEDQKDYLYWNYQELKNLCNHAPTYYPGKKNVRIRDTICDTQPVYRLETRTYKSIGELRGLSIKELVDQLDELSFSVWMLDDGNHHRKAWKLCTPFSDEICYYIIDKIYEKFNIQGGLSPNNTIHYNYIRFIRSESRKIDDYILRNIPNDLDVVQHKILAG